jgi:putative nucleotidyltransferase with HDIG domain
MALISSKRSGRNASVYTSEMEAETSIVGSELPPQRNQALANALVRAVDAKDSYTRSHSQTVSQLCALIAAELGLEPQHVEQVRLAALLHDVGKIGVPDAILRKQGKLTEEELEQLQAHSILGDEILSAAGLRTEARWIRHHHERYDGDGYPDRIAGDEIPIESRIIFAADAFEAMTSDRPYREGPGDDYALAELRRDAGDQFDPDVVDALTRAIGTASQGTDSEATAQGATS